ncbi:GNAT family N-acetyltransferase [Clostridium sp. Cult1]|uniref:GNAT family N-acetyltransferase n=1 Tax=Clostridium sp. Cult1 TaxID=2079002 RepID=UPI001F2D9A34|nr:GNAT family protein [Clostridium sp. Cult1]
MPGGIGKKIVTKVNVFVEKPFIDPPPENEPNAFNWISGELFNYYHDWEIIKFEEIIRFAFEDNYVFRISTGCIKDNLGSKKVMQKCGMIKEAELKMIEWYDGRMKDRVLYRLLKNEWVVNGAKKSIQNSFIKSSFPSSCT